MRADRSSRRVAGPYLQLLVKTIVFQTRFSRSSKPLMYFATDTQDDGPRLAAFAGLGYSVAFTTAAALVHELMEVRDERRLRALQKHLNTNS